MNTVGEAVATVEQWLLVARERELDLFRHWLLNPIDTAQLLNVSGPPGVGKTTLLQAFAREASSLGWKVATADGHRVGPSEDNLICALSDDRSAVLEDLVTGLNRRGTLVVLDSFEHLEHLTTFLQQELLLRLDTSTKVVIAGRRPLVVAWSRADGWPKIVRLMPLEGFTSRECSIYLSRRRITQHELVGQIVSVTAGNPLAMSLAADLITQLGVRDLASDPQWHLATRSLARRLLSEVADDLSVREAVEACSVVRVFDEATLAAITGQADASGVFDRLCRLSIVKPATYGLTLHDHVREIVSSDLRWRKPHHHRLLRQRALDYFKERLRGSSETERGWLIMECFFLWENPLIREMFFGPETLGTVTVEAARDTDVETLLALHWQSSHQIAGFEEDAHLIRDVAGFPLTRIRVAKVSEDGPVGFSMVLPLCQESVSILERHPVHAGLVRTYLASSGRQLLPVNAADATMHYMLPVVAVSDQKGAVRCALFREIATIFGSNGTYLCMSREASTDRLLAECAFDMVAELKHCGIAVKGWALDLTRIGFEGWIQAVIDGRHVESSPNSSQLEDEILAALMHWTDPAWLAVNCRQISSGAALAERAEVTREVIKEAFSRARADGSGSADKALRALELAYMNRRTSHKQAIHALSVSRATFYRLCKRGVKALAEQVVNAPRAAPR